MKQIEIFISYAHRDRELAKMFLEQLSILEEQYPSIYIWSEDYIYPGQNREQAIREHLEQASIILLLISPDFLASENNMLTQIEAKQRAGEAIVIPIILRPTDLSRTFLANIQSLPTRNRPLYTWLSPHMAFQDIIDEIEKAINTLKNSPS